MRHFNPVSKMLPFWNLNPPIVSHAKVSAVVGLWSSSAEDAPRPKNRFGHVGPGMEQNQESQTANSFASPDSTGIRAVVKHCITSPGLGDLAATAKLETNPLLLMGG